jgi:23S rRNA (uracil1939-C5)-methyltransferase
MHTRLEATVGSLAPGGDGIVHAQLEGERRAIFVPLTAPGDVVRVDVDASRRPARGRVLEVLARGPDRVDPPCPWSSRCGGCDWMHLSAEAQQRWRVAHVRAALPAPWRDTDITAHPAPAGLAYRTRARLHVRCEAGRAVVGMHEAHTHAPVEVDACAVLHPALEAARGRLGAWLASSRGRGDVQIALGAGRAPVLDVQWRGDLAPACFGHLEQAVARGEIAGARVTLAEATRPATIGDPTPWMAGPDGAPLRLAPGGFGQAHEQVNADLAQHVAEQARACGAEAGKAVELYAGAGNLSVLLARVAPDLVAVESSREACEAARGNLAARGLAARVVEADAGAYAWSASTRLVVLDPPRTGARAVAERLAASRVTHVVYVSCDPATLGRDLTLLAASHELRAVRVFEMFPQTSHVEVVATLARRRS